MLVLNTIRLNFIEALPSSALALHKTGRRQLEPSDHTTASKEKDVFLTNVLNNATQSPLMMELADLQADFIEDCCKSFLNKWDKTAYQILADTQKCKRRWHSERQFRITGSRIYEIYTYNGKDWLNKSLKYFYPKTFTNKYVRHGLTHETSARTTFVEATGLSVLQCGLVVSEGNPWLGYSPDGLVVDNNEYPEQLIEIKCPFEGATQSIGSVIQNLLYLIFEDGIYCLKQNHKYYGQVQIGMAILNVDKCKFIIYCSYDSIMAIIDVLV
ncbi:hypothetical protein RN001_005809 [Aquatica leii]|uniref:YqaJ viral recombinase domain-containing protein n=1 Tax=Aquatica leii TaxID=1421715 RepID=A0AAN7P720_9COLE|nr:hypothetical protein RN001_005809 [Aquatica leii]